MNLREKLDDLLLQATTERSHYYVASVIREVIAALAEKDKKIEALSHGLRGLHECHKEQIATLKAEVERMRKALKYINEVAENRYAYQLAHMAREALKEKT